jgi:cytochrome c-type biogenesis protein
MVWLFTALTKMLDAAPALALSASFVWGVLSIILSPCHLAGIPLIVSHIASKNDGTKRTAAVMAFLFSLGILTTLLLIGMITTLFGRIAGDTGPVGSYIVGGLLIFFGLNLAGCLPFTLFNYKLTPEYKKKGLLPAFLFGLIFGLALGPCTFAFMAPVIAVGFHSARARPALGYSLIILFSIGHCLVIVIAGVLTETVRSILKWNKKHEAFNKAKKVLGFLVTAGGGFLIVWEVLA